MKQETITRPSPPPDLLDHMIKYLVMRISKLKPGEKPPPAEWLKWLQATERAMVEANTVRIEILSRSDMEKFLNIDSLEW